MSMPGMEDSDNNSWDDDDDSYGDGDEFELEESLDQLGPASPNKVETANAENNEEKNQNNNQNNSNEEDDYADSDFDDEDEQRDTPTKLQPPQPVVALVLEITSAKLLQSSSVIEQQISPLLILSQEQTCAVSGRSKTLPKEEPPSLAGKINCDGSSGIAIPFK